MVDLEKIARASLEAGIAEGLRQNRIDMKTDSTLTELVAEIDRILVGGFVARDYETLKAVRAVLATQGAATHPAPEPVGLSKRSAELIFETLQFYANVTTYQAERIGGVLQGCPRGPKPTPHELADEARRVLEQVESELRAAYAAPAKVSGEERATGAAELREALRLGIEAAEEVLNDTISRYTRHDGTVYDHLGRVAEARATVEKIRAALQARPPLEGE